MKIEARVELAPRTTLGVGGHAAHFLRVENNSDLCDALAWAKERKLSIRVLGGGSNIVVADAGFSGLVVEMAQRGVELAPRGEAVQVRAAAGEPWDEFVAAMVAAGYQGLECLSGIPGRVGATPIQNVGAYGQDVSETITSVRAYDTLESGFRDFSSAECGFAYRSSAFKSSAVGRFIVVEVTFSLRVGASPALRYAELERHFAERGEHAPSLEAVRQAVLSLRRAKSMLLDPSDPNARSCGSFFLNPSLSQEEYDAFAGRAVGEGDVPRFPQADGRLKLSAGWLIEHAGFRRGLRDGAVGLSSKHALAVVAHDGARAADVLRLAGRIQQGVSDRFGVRLEREPVFWSD